MGFDEDRNWNLFGKTMEIFIVAIFDNQLENQSF
jgi:hypothetical protein